MAEIKLTDATFQQEVLNEMDKPVLVDFWAEWCPPCKLQGPIIEEVAKAYEGKAKVATMEVDQNPQFPQQYGILSIPTLIMFKQGKPVWQGVGLQDKAKIDEAFEKVLGS